jgi:hypothetical protein
MSKRASFDGPTFADAELMAIANACVEAARARELADDAAEKAEAKREPLAPPAAIRNPQRDAELGLFDGLDAAADRHEDLLRRLVFMPALTLDGVVAKARAFDSLFGDDDALARTAESDLAAFGPNESVLARALARDLLRLARAATPPGPESRDSKP